MRKTFIFILLALGMAVFSYAGENGNIDDQFQRGVALFQQKEYDQALAEFAKVVEIDNNNVLSYYYLGLLYEAKLLQEKDQGKAMEIKNKAIESWSTFIQKGNDIDLKYLTTAKKHLKRLAEECPNEQK